MKTVVRHAVLLMAATAMCQAGFALAEDFRWTSGNSQPSTYLTGDQQPAAKEQAPCSSGCGQNLCGGEGCGSGCGSDLGCDACPCRGIVGFAGFDSFKGISDGDWPSNFGVVTGLNTAVPLPTEYGLNWQLGMSYGVYDFDGRDSTDFDNAQSQQQIFVTTGFFHKAQGDKRLSYGLVYDWMVNNNWGEFGTSPTLGQWRGQVEYAVSGCNAFGVLVCVRDRKSEQVSPHDDEGVLVENRTVNQTSFFWHHKFCQGADSWLYVGIPGRDRLTGEGSLGDWTVGANVQVPLTERLAMYANASYFRPSEAAGSRASIESGYDVGMGIAWYFGGHAVSHSINGACGLPYMPVANNSTFLVDQKVTER
jgi:hypothetical protein